GPILPVGVQLQREHEFHRGASAPDESPRECLHHQCRRFFRPKRDRSGEVDPARSRRTKSIPMETFLASAAPTDLRSFPRALWAEVCYLPIARNGGLLQDPAQ